MFTRRHVFLTACTLPLMPLTSLLAKTGTPLVPRFVDMAGQTPSRQQIIDWLRQQQKLPPTRTRKLNLAPMLNAEGAVADSTPAETVAVKSESPRLSFDQITFEFGSAKIASTALPLLQEIGTALRSNELEGLRFMIEGHTDAVGDLQYNMRLSSRRADAVKRHLVSRYALSPRRLLTTGKGPTDLHEPNNPTSAANRRVVLMAFEGTTAA
jgi:outer membrane protein OmpA-like peptidoglycan-associated protein